MNRLFVVVVAACVALSTAACSKKLGEGEATDSLTARGGVPDDGVKPMPKPAPIGTGTVARVGVPDDGVKPVVKPAPGPAPTPIPYPNNPRGGVPDDSIKPVPVPSPR